MLAELAPYLPAEDRPAVLTQALAAATTIPSDSSRAQALARLAPHLPAEDRPAVLTQALAAATAIPDDSSRAQVLARLAPHLPADQLADALAAAPRTIADPLTAVLERGSQVLLSLPDGERSWLELLKNGLDGTARVSCLSVIEAVTPTIARIGGPTAIRECVKAIEDVHRWWP